ncbi:MAG: hemagglutinin repeat-containing protein, partial [Desulfobulbus sp.]|nr:hemagglutinin repeat-containing protein [Desulfobulbus sp.]
QTAEQMNKASKNTSDDRMKALAAGATALSAYNAATAVQAGQGSTINGKDNQFVVTDKGQPVWQKDSAGNILKDASGNPIPETRDANMADKVGGINISVSLGTSKSSSKTEQASDTAKGSTVMAGGNINITASGAGENSNITIQGSDITAGNNVNLAADNDIRLLAAQNTASQHSSNKSSSASVGVGFSLGGQSNGFTINAGVSGARGNADGSDLIYSNTHVSAGNQVALQSGQDTLLKGATVTAPQVVADIGGDLLIQSLQDISTFDSQQKSLGASVSLCIPPLCYGASSASLSFSKSKIDSNYQSVTEQSGIRAGDQGFQVDVKGDTTLTGGAITSTQEAIDDDKNRFTTGGELTLSDIENKASYKASSMGANIGGGVNFSGGFMPQATGAGVGSDSDKASSVTQSGISGIAGNAGARTGDAETGLKPIFDAEKVQKEIDAQVMITREFSAQATQAVKTYAAKETKAYTEAQAKRNEAQHQLNADDFKPDGEKISEEERAKLPANGVKMSAEDRAELQRQVDYYNGIMADNKESYDKWGPTGSYSMAASILIAALSGDATSTGVAVTRESLAWAANEMRQAMIEDSRNSPNICDSEGRCISNLGSSVGVNGDGTKVGGGRLDFDALCPKDKCVRDEDKNLVLKDGNVQFIGNIEDFIKENPGLRSPLGGIQGLIGQIPLLGDYTPGSWQDILVEAYAGAHDMLNSWYWYGSDGNIRQGMTNAERKAGEALNIVNVPLATSFAAATLIPPDVLQFLFAITGR